MNSKWAVSLPVYFAGHFTGIVFRRQDAILVDSLDFALVTREFNRWHRPSASSGLCEQDLCRHTHRLSCGGRIPP